MNEEDACLGERLPNIAYLPVNICGKAGKTLQFDLNQMPHLLITGGISDAHTAVVRQMLIGWKTCTLIKPVVIDLTGKLTPEKTADSETFLRDKLHEMTGILECRYDELAMMKIKSVGAYLAQGHQNMPFHPVIILGFEKVLSTIHFSDDIFTPFCRLSRKGRAAGIDLVLCSTDKKIMKGFFAANCPAKLVFRSADEKDFIFSSPVISQINNHEANAYFQERTIRHSGVEMEKKLNFFDGNCKDE